MVLKQTVIISSTSTVVLILLTSVVVYFYTSYARPETVHPKKLKEEFKKREESVLDVVKSIKIRFPDNLKVIESIARPATENVPVDLGPQTPLKDNEIKLLFKNIASIDNKKVPKPREIEQINPIKFPPLKMPEPPVVEVPKSFRPSEEVFVGQVGLSLYTETFFAAVYRIQNLFGKAGLVGHYFVMNPNLDWDTFGKFKTAQMDFSSKDHFKNIFKDQMTIEPPQSPSSKSKMSIILVNPMSEYAEALKVAVEPEQTGEKVFYFNPYKWLHLATILKPLMFDPTPVIHALIFPEDEVENQDGIVYPSDVRVYEIDWMKTADVSLHSGCIKRIENHCRVYFGKDAIPL